jgi:cell division transport system ATP-binding protein
VLSISNVDFNYSNQTVFTNLNLEMEPGEFVFLIGKSGVGKSTLLQLIYMNIFPNTGIVQFDKYSSNTIKPRQLPFLRRKLGVVFQDFKLLRDRNVYDNLSFILEATNTPKKEVTKKINDSLTQVGLQNKKLNMPNQLSGGEKQRVSIARALLHDPILILADEPTGNLDPETSSEVTDILQKINKHGTAVLFATHNYEIVKKIDAKIYKLDDGRAFKAVIKRPASE